MEGLARLGALRIGAHAFQIIPFTYLRAPGGGRPPGRKGFPGGSGNTLSKQNAR